MTIDWLVFGFFLSRVTSGMRAMDPMALFLNYELINLEWKGQIGRSKAYYHPPHLQQIYYTKHFPLQISDGLTRERSVPYLLQQLLTYRNEDTGHNFEGKGLMLYHH